ncbi:NAD(P)/FAD-dependent oxidoreductase [Mycobacterium sp. MS1601]|uniref:NAD(P)/FAD-dependent oxidoreductase n=1 Tax=Mycobacterium sp. MS1601 TaxID=1936029 RepID=UPI003FA5C461
MAFVDTLISETAARVVMVDRQGQPGGHWNAAYPFVRLHQPSAYYGVNSQPLGSDTIDTDGLNAGFYELAGGPEVLAYFDAVMRQRLLPSGQVSYFPMSDYLGERRFRTLGGDVIEVAAGRVVDSTHVGVTVPAMQPPPYPVVSAVTCIPPNDLPRMAPRDRYVIVGAGKTAMDSCLWLLRHGVAPERLTWIKPRDAWLLDRAAIQPGREFAKRVMADVSAQLRAVEASASVPDLFEKLDAAGCLLRVDESVTPTMYRCAIVSAAELEQLRRIEHVVRLGRVQRIVSGKVVLEQGSIAVDHSALFVNCSSDGLGSRGVATVFDGDTITLQTVRTCQPVFSASVIAHVEATHHDDAVKNSYCRPVPNPHEPLDWLRMMLAYNSNQLTWFGDPDMMAWLDSVRLNVLSHANAGVSERARAKIINMLSAQLVRTNTKLEALLGP